MSRVFVVLCGTALLLALAPAGPAPGAPVPKHLMPKDEALYFPTDVGAKWVYLLGGDREVAYEVSKVEDVKDTPGAKLVTVTGGDFSPVCWQVSPAGLLLWSIQGEACDPPTPMLRMPAAKLKKWDVQQLNASKLKGLFEAGGVEEVEVKAGKFTAQRVELEWVNNNKVTLWFAPGVGEVKSVNGLHQELKSFTAGKK